MRLRINHLWPLGALVLLNGCILGGGARTASQPAPLANGPAADYPVVIGKPFTIGDVTYTPTDAMNYDAVGYASVAPQKGGGVTASHKTLPLPSYAEVTSLKSGRTILVRVENRGPMTNDRLIELSPEAAAQLGLSDTDKAPVRVRRVNPPEQERALLRAGKEAPERMETPQALLKVLNRKLAEHSPLSPASPAPAPAASHAGTGEPGYKPVVAATKAPGPASTVTSQSGRTIATEATVAASTPPPPASSETAKPKAARKDFVVQVAAFSTQARADAAAKSLDAKVSKPGKYWLVRLGPYASQAAASGGLAKARAAGYRDARIQRLN